MSITSSIFISKEARVIDFSCEILPEENSLIKGVQYQNINNSISIVDSISRKKIFQISENPNVQKIESNPDLGLAYFIKSEEPGKEIASVYRVDINTNYVYKISHLRIKYIDTAGFEGIVEKFVLGATPESYVNIISYLQHSRLDNIEGIVVKVDNEWIPLSDIKPSCLLPIVKEDDSE